MIIFIVIVLVLLVGGLSYFLLNKEKKDSVIITLDGDFTSSGGSRVYTANLTFEDRKITSGYQKYETESTFFEYTIRECIIDTISLKWVQKDNKDLCSINFIEIPLSLDLLMEKLKSDDLFRTSEECTHNTICYEIIS